MTNFLLAFYRRFDKHLILLHPEAMHFTSNKSRFLKKPQRLIYNVRFTNDF